MDKETFDLQDLEDLFQCIEVLTRARVAVIDSDPDLAGDLARITNTLVAFAEGDGQPAGPPAPGASPAPERKAPAAEDKAAADSAIYEPAIFEYGPVAEVIENGPAFPPDSDKKEEDEGIIDILTGETLRKGSY